MSMEIKQHLKLSQQLVMTPQLQQAIKLLQLSRVELVDMVREELLENPVLEDSVEIAAEQQKPAPPPARRRRQLRRRKPKPNASARPRFRWREMSEDKIDTTTEVKPDARSGDAVADFDWDTYLETQSNAAAHADLPAEHRGSALPGGDAYPGHLALRPSRVAAQAVA